MRKKQEVLKPRGLNTGTPNDSSDRQGAVRLFWKDAQGGWSLEASRGMVTVTRLPLLPQN